MGEGETDQDNKDWLILDDLDLTSFYQRILALGRNRVSMFDQTLEASVSHQEFSFVDNIINGALITSFLIRNPGPKKRHLNRRCLSII
jgi:hypothetical protein